MERKWQPTLEMEGNGNPLHQMEGNGNPLQYSCLENPRDGGAWWAAVYGAAQSRTRLKRLGSSSSGSVDGSLPASAGDTDSIPGLGRFSYACEPQPLGLCSRALKPKLLSPCAATTEALHLEPMLANKRSHCNEQPMHCNEQ